jgi:hypothetical protein
MAAPLTSLVSQVAPGRRLVDERVDGRLIRITTAEERPARTLIHTGLLCRDVGD